MGQAIVDTAKNRFGGNQVAAQIFHLGNIIEAGGGLNLGNINVMFDRLHDVFSLLETGALRLNRRCSRWTSCSASLRSSSTRDGALASKALLEIIRLNNELGTSSRPVAEFVTAQVTSAIGGLTTFLENAEVSSQAAASGISAAVSVRKGA